MNAETKDEHVHAWEPGGTIKNDRVLRSPCSQLDDVLFTEHLQVMVCSCGAVKKVRVGVTNERRRGDEVRRNRRRVA